MKIILIFYSRIKSINIVVLQLNKKIQLIDSLKYEKNCKN